MAATWRSAHLSFTRAHRPPARVQSPVHTFFIHRPTAPNSLCSRPGPLRQLEAQCGRPQDGTGWELSPVSSQCSQEAHWVGSHSAGVRTRCHASHSSLRMPIPVDPLNRPTDCRHSSRARRRIRKFIASFPLPANLPCPWSTGTTIDSDSWYIPGPRNITTTWEMECRWSSASSTAPQPGPQYPHGKPRRLMTQAFSRRSETTNIGQRTNLVIPRARRPGAAEVMNTHALRKFPKPRDLTRPPLHMTFRSGPTTSLFTGPTGRLRSSIGTKQYNITEHGWICHQQRLKLVYEATGQPLVGHPSPTKTTIFPPRSTAYVTRLLCGRSFRTFIARGPSVLVPTSLGNPIPPGPSPFQAYLSRAKDPNRIRCIQTSTSSPNSWRLRHHSTDREAFRN